MAEVEMQNLPGTPVTFQESAQQDQAPVAPVNGENVQGMENPGYTHEAPGQVTDDILPPMTYVDFVPLLLEDSITPDETPKYAEFRTVIEQANQWLKGNPNFAVMKCESFAKRLLAEDKLDIEVVTHHESSYGVNKYVRGLRLWLAPRLPDSGAPQELGYLTILPDTGEGSSEGLMSMFMPGRFQNGQASMPSFCGIAETMEKLNKFLKKKPVPGSILNVESLDIKYEETNPNSNLDTEQMCWAESGKTQRVFITALRVYYVIGKPAFEVIGIHDELPVCQNNFEVLSRLRLSPFTSIVQRARKWLRLQKGIKVVNMQTVSVFCDRTSAGEARIHSNKAGYVEAPGHDIQLAKILRIFYTVDAKSNEVPYEHLNLTTRLFIPTRHGGYGKSYDSFSKTLQRVITWLQLTNVPIFGVETVTYPYSPEGYGSGVQDDQASVTRMASAGKHHITTLRLYFTDEFKEPPPEIMPVIQEEESWYACSVS